MIFEYDSLDRSTRGDSTRTALNLINLDKLVEHCPGLDTPVKLYPSYM